MEVIDLKFYNKGIPAQTICLRFFRNLKESLVFRACLVAGSFFLKLKATAMCFKFNIFQDNMTGNIYAQFFSQVASIIRDPSQAIFVGIISSRKF